MQGKYDSVFIKNFAYRIPDEEVKTTGLENHILDLLKHVPFKIPDEFLNFYTGIRSRFLWPEKIDPAKECQNVAKRCLEGIDSKEVLSLRYGTLTRHFIEPATIAAIMSGLDLSKKAMGYDITNACLGMTNSIVSVANDIQLGTTNLGLALGFEDSRRIIQDTLEYLRAYYLAAKDKGTLRVMTPTLTLGSGTIAVLLGKDNGIFRLNGYVALNDTSCSELCVGEQKDGKLLMETYAESLEKKGIPLVKDTIKEARNYFGWDKVDLVVTHQVGKTHQKAASKELEHIAEIYDFVTYPELGNIGSISMPLTLIKAYEQGKIKPRDKILAVAFASGLFTCCLGLEAV